MAIDPDRPGEDPEASRPSDASHYFSLFETGSSPLLFQSEEYGLTSNSAFRSFTQPESMSFGGIRRGTYHSSLPARDFSQLSFGESYTKRRDVLTQFAGGHKGTENLSAFLDMLAYSEGTMQRGNNGGYDVQVGGGRFEGNQHPHEVIDLGRGLKSSAAGRYQFLGRTWDALAAELKLKDFSPASQDAAALRLVEQCGALKDVLEGRIDVAAYKCRGIWASLPGAGYGQHENRFGDLYRVYQASLQKNLNKDVAANSAGSPNNGSQTSAAPATIAVAGSDENRVFENQSTEASVRIKPISPELRASLQYAAAQAGVYVKVYSGGQDPFGMMRTGSHRHDNGNAADVNLFVMENGKLRVLDFDASMADRTIYSKFITAAVAAGQQGVGAEGGYMGSRSAHVGGGAPAVWGTGGTGGGPDWLRAAWQEGMNNPVPPAVIAAASATLGKKEADASPTPPTKTADRKKEEEPVKASVSSADTLSDVKDEKKEAKAEPPAANKPNRAELSVAAAKSSPKPAEKKAEAGKAEPAKPVASNAPTAAAS